MTFPLSKFPPALLFMTVLFALRGAAQEPEDRKPRRPESMGVATGTPHASVKDALSRPITAGGFVDGAPVVFADITKQAGLDKFHLRSGALTLDKLSSRPTWHRFLSCVLACFRTVVPHGSGASGAGNNHTVVRQNEEKALRRGVETKSTKGPS